MRWGVSIVAMLLTLTIAQPAHAAVISESQEIDLGRQAARQLEHDIGVVDDRAMNDRIRGVGRRVAVVSGRPGLPWTFKVMRGKEVNAVSLPGGFIYATEGLMRFVRSDDELAFVLGHEVGHVAARHHIAMIERYYFMSIVIQIVLGRSPSAAQLAEIVQLFLTRGYSRENEFEADRLGVIHAHRAKFDASAGLSFMQRLRAAEGRDPSQVEVLLRTHPGLADRATRVREQLKQLGYRVRLDPRPRLALSAR
jgi:predicted Zn-dependent protease